jgi:hypothetical protein
MEGLGRSGPAQNGQQAEGGEADEELSDRELAIMGELAALVDAVRGQGPSADASGLVGFITGQPAAVATVQKGEYYNETESWSAESSNPLVKVSQPC